MMKELVLIVDDEEGIRETLSGIFADEGYEVITSDSGEKAISMAKESLPDIVFLDVWLPGIDGVDTLKELRLAGLDMPIIVISGHGNIELAVKATKEGAYDFLEKPLSLDRVLIVARRALEKRSLEIEIDSLKKVAARKWQMIGESAKIHEVMSAIALAAQSNSRVIIFGESGSGKELVARLLHEQSPRRLNPFVEVNCAAIPEELIESELFGHEKGAFTGALEQKKGKFELADSGTLFLDEIGDMSLPTQAKALRVIETQEFQRVGGNKNIRVDVRIVAATNKVIREEVKKGHFREDLFFRLNVIPITVPPLRERKEDIPLLVQYFLKTLGDEYGQQPKKISPDALKRLQTFDWKGNVRELRNFIERLVIMVPSNLITEKTLLSSPQDSVSDYSAYSSIKDAREAFEKDFILRKLEETDWNISRTAELIGIERSNLYKKIKQYDIIIP